MAQKPQPTDAPAPPPTRDGGVQESVAISTPTKEELLRLLEGEIAHALADEARPGWSRWVLFAALAAVLWALIDQLSAPFNLRIAIALGALFAVAWETLQRIDILLTLNIQAPSQQRFLLASSSSGIKLARAAFLYYLARSAGFILLFKYLSADLGRRTTLEGIAFFGVFMILDALVFLVSFLPLPLSRSLSRRKHFRPVLGLFVPMLLLGSDLVYRISTWLAPQLASGLAHEFKIAGAAVVALHLISLLLNEHASSPLVPSMMSLRRSLLLRTTTLAEAARETEILLLGLGVTDVLQARVSRLLQIMDNMRSVEREAKKALHRFDGGVYVGTGPR